MTGTILTHIVAITIADRDGCKIYKGCISYNTVKIIYFLRWFTKWSTFKLLTSPLPFVLRKSKVRSSITGPVARVITLDSSVPVPVTRAVGEFKKALHGSTEKLLDREDFEEKLKQIGRKERRSINKNSLEIEGDNIKENIIEIWKFSAEVIERFIFVLMSIITLGYFGYYMVMLFVHADREANMCYKYFPWDKNTGDEEDAKWLTDNKKCII